MNNQTFKERFLMWNSHCGPNVLSPYSWYVQHSCSQWGCIALFSSACRQCNCFAFSSRSKQHKTSWLQYKLEPWRISITDLPQCSSTKGSRKSMRADVTTAWPRGDQREESAACMWFLFEAAWLAPRLPPGAALLHRKCCVFASDKQA